MGWFDDSLGVDPLSSPMTPLHRLARVANTGAVPAAMRRCITRRRVLA